MIAKFVRENVVHFGLTVGELDGLRVFFLCEKKMLFGALFGGPGHDKPPLYEPGVEVFDVDVDVDCMTCIVAGAHIKAWRD